MLDMFNVADAARILHIVFCFIDPPYIMFGGLYYIDKVRETVCSYVVATWGTVKLLSCSRGEDPENCYPRDNS
jgi:hypothetical protein